MNRFTCDGSYQKDWERYTQQVLDKYGVSSQTAERETMCLANAGNKAAVKLYADMIFHKKILCRYPYRMAFELYLEAAGITVDPEGEWSCSGKSYPLSFWLIGYYLVNYRRESFLKKCEKIGILEEMSLPARLSLALELACACIVYTEAPGAINLTGRLLSMIAADPELFSTMQPAVEAIMKDLDFPAVSLPEGSFDNPVRCAAAGELFFSEAASRGYVYACNSLAAREAARIIRLCREPGWEEDEETEAEAAGCVARYLSYLKRPADKYEPYAANRLGLFYMTGEVKTAEETAVLKGYTDYALAREYFRKATVYPDSNSAWAYYNLLKYFHQDYVKDIDRMNEHIEAIRELNPKVYELVQEL